MDRALFTLRCFIFSLFIVSIFAEECTDSKFNLATGNGGFKTISCPDFLAEKGGAACRHEFMKSTCCASCTAIETGDSACPYGDAMLNFRGESMSCTDYLKDNPATCEHVQDSCCATCKKFHTGNDKCPYGDGMLNFRGQYQTCSAYLATYGKNRCEHPYIAKTCCQSCTKDLASDPECPYGDGMLNFRGQAPQTCSAYLTTNGKRRCEHAYIAKTCCQSCKKDLASDSECPYGDGMINFRGEPPKKCIDYLAERGAQVCSNPSIKSTCCKSCAEAKTGKDDCPYGDRKSLIVNGRPMTCEEYLPISSGCSNPNNRENCCATCAKYATGDDDCPYGDGWLSFNGKPPMNCSTYLSQEGARYCSQEYVSKKCCQTCPKLSTGKADCPYGNVKRINVNGRAMTCEEYLPLSAGCNNAGVRDTCCETCAAKHTGVAACPYGEAEYLNLRTHGRMTCPELLRKFGHNQCQQTWVKEKCCESCA